MAYSENSELNQDGCAHHHDQLLASANLKESTGVEMIVEMISFGTNIENAVVRRVFNLLEEEKPSSLENNGADLNIRSFSEARLTNIYILREREG